MINLDCFVHSSALDVWYVEAVKHDKTHFAGNAGYEMYVSSRLVMVEQPQFLRPSKITVTEATQRQERPNVPFREIASYKTLDEQEAFVGSLLTT